MHSMKRQHMGFDLILREGKEERFLKLSEARTHSTFLTLSQYPLPPISTVASGTCLIINKVHPESPQSLPLSERKPKPSPRKLPPCRSQEWKIVTLPDCIISRPFLGEPLVLLGSSELKAISPFLHLCIHPTNMYYCLLCTRLYRTVNPQRDQNLLRQSHSKNNCQLQKNKKVYE